MTGSEEANTPRREADELDRWRMADGTPVLIRPIRSDDAAQEVRFLLSLSQQTRYERTFSHRGLLAPGELRRLIRFDIRQEIALVAVAAADTGDEFVAVARLKKLPDSNACEFAIVVADAWHHRGIGVRLLNKLLDVARRGGIARVVGYTFATNEAMKRLAAKSGFTLRPDPDDASATILEIAL